MPVKETSCGVCAAVSLTTSKPVKVSFFGWVLLAGPSKLTVIAHDCPGSRVLGQLFVWEKYNPLTLIPSTFSVETPVFVRVAIWGGVQPPPTKRATQEKFILPGVSVAVVAAPMPLRETVCGLPGAVSATESVPLTLPIALGMNVMLIVQLAPDGRLEPQVSVSPKLAVAAMPTMLSVVVP